MSFHNHDEDIINRMRRQNEIDKKEKKENVTQGGARGNSLWRRYRFQTKSIDDYRPLIFNPKYPWWCSGHRADGYSATIVAYLPLSEDLKKYWDDAFEIEFTEKREIAFSDRFPKPTWFTP